MAEDRSDARDAEQVIETLLHGRACTDREHAIGWCAVTAEAVVAALSAAGWIITCRSCRREQGDAVQHQAVRSASLGDTETERATMTSNHSPQQSPDDEDVEQSAYNSGVAAERARCITELVAMYHRFAELPPNDARDYRMEGIQDSIVNIGRANESSASVSASPGVTP